VSHDGEAIYGAQVVAAMEAQAFVERDINKLIDTALSLIPRDSVIARMIGEIREWHAGEPDWRKTRERIAATYGYDKFGGNCHMVPNHALITLALLYGEDDFQKSLLIVNTSGWDTDCNSGNVGCLLGIKNGLAGIEAGPDWRGPVADRLYLPTADGGRAITDAVRETYHVVNIGRALAGAAPLAPKGGARFHFELPGSVQGFQAEESVEVRGTLTLENVAGHSREGGRSLALRYRQLAPGRVARAATATFIPPEAISMGGYELLASPTLYPGQTLRAGLSADAQNGQPVVCQLYLRLYGANDELVRVYGPEALLAPGAEQQFSWEIPSTDGAPIAVVGVELRAPRRADGSVYLDFLTWEGTPRATFGKPRAGGTMWRRAWVNGIDQYDRWWPEDYRLVQNEGTGLLIQGTREWANYRVSAQITPHMVRAAGIAACVQGMRRYYALLLDREGQARLVKALDGDTVLASAEFDWSFGASYALRLQVVGARIQGWIDERLLFDVEDRERPLLSGAIGLICSEGRAAADHVAVEPATSM